MKVGKADVASIRRAGGFWLSLHGVEGAARLPELKGKDMGELVKEANAVIPGLSTYPFGMIGNAQVTTIEDGIGVAFISVGPEGVWVNTSHSGGLDTYGSPGMHENRVKASMSPAVYQIAQAYAKNNGLRFIPDPAGVSAIATFRRWPQLLSSAIRMGDTTHIDGTKDVEGWKDGDHEHNAGLLAMHEYEYVRHFFPEIDALRLSADSATIVDHAGAPVSRQTLADLLVGERHPSRLGIGKTTLRRALVTGQLAAEGRLEPGSETGTGERGERRVHPGAVQNFVSDLGSGAAGPRPRHALKEISYSIGSEPDSPNQPHQQDHGQESGMVPGTGESPDSQRRSEEESRRRIREALSRAEEDYGEERIGDGSESYVFRFGPSQVLKEFKSDGIVRYLSDGSRTTDSSLEAAREKASVIEALGGMPTTALTAGGKVFIVQDRGTPISETDYLSIELPFGIEPSRHGIYKIEIDGEDYLISDLRPENFVKDPQGNIRLIDLITGKVAKGSTPK
ncbi:MAG: hypothetical protein KF712_04625 [Akkermansiaceae bacterium]|nr:hypothetical protein [Akkermansiaceae bacterium]